MISSSAADDYQDFIAKTYSPKSYRGFWGGAIKHITSAFWLSNATVKGYANISMFSTMSQYKMNKAAEEERSFHNEAEPSLVFVPAWPISAADTTARDNTHKHTPRGR